MGSFRGDAHKFYLKLKKEARKDLEPEQLQEIQELKAIQDFYRSIDTPKLENIHNWILKEKNGSGLIPILVTAVPWVLFIFGNQVQAFFENDDGYMEGTKKGWFYLFQCPFSNKRSRCSFLKPCLFSPNQLGIKYEQMDKNK